MQESRYSYLGAMSLIREHELVRDIEKLAEHLHKRCRTEKYTGMP